jgi:hypothetical protein
MFDFWKRLRAPRCTSSTPMPARPTTERDTFDPLMELAAHAAHLDGLNNADMSAKPFYDLMSGALVWRDETNNNTPTGVIWALRPICAYRTSLMLNEPREELAMIWNFGLAHFPRWNGFRPERWQATPELLRIYRAGNVRLRKCLRDTERDHSLD